jgi:hypothetical protein
MDHKSTQHNNPDDHNLHIQNHKNLNLKQFKISGKKL